METKPLLAGVRGLLTSKKGVLCLLILLSMVVLGFFGKIDGVALSAGFTLIGSIYCWTASRVDLAALQKDKTGQPSYDPNSDK